MKRMGVHASNCNDYSIVHKTPPKRYSRVSLYKEQWEEPIEWQQQIARAGCDKRDNLPLPQPPRDAHAPHHRDITHEIWHRSGCQKSLLSLPAR